MGTPDGGVIGTTKIVDNGPDNRRFNVVLLSEGYRRVQLPQFAADAQAFVQTLQATVPFNGSMNAINVHQIDVWSTDSGADDPVATGGTGATARTYFDATFGNGGLRRALVVNNGLVIQTANAQVPAWHMLLVIVNSTIYGGTGGRVAVFSLASNANEVALHEMGHTAFGLADEYQYYQGCGVDTNRNLHPAIEPTEPNVTVNNNRNTIKWRNLIAATTTVPTMQNPNCANCDNRPSSVPAGTVGAFEGAHYYHCGAYRPEYDCKMRALGQPFCAVCSGVIRQVLAPFLPGYYPAHAVENLNYGLDLI
jgi:hypothetical protein